MGYRATPFIAVEPGERKEILKELLPDRVQHLRKGFLGLAPRPPSWSAGAEHLLFAWCPVDDRRLARATTARSNGPQRRSGGEQVSIRCPSGRAGRGGPAGEDASTDAPGSPASR